MSDQWNHARTIRASEIGNYIYCNRQWWLKRHHGVKSVQIEKMQQGTDFHQEHWAQIGKAARNDKLVYVLIGVAITVILLWILLSLG